MSAKLPYPMAMLQSGRSHDPFALLGLHRTGERPVVRTFMPQAESVELDGFGAMARIPNTDIFEILLSEEQLAELPAHYRFTWVEKADGQSYSEISPYSFAPLLADLDLHLFGEGRHHHVYRVLGAHCIEIDGISGCRFAVWALSVSWRRRDP